MVVEQILSGIGAGITYALTGWGKAKGEDFDWSKFLTTCSVGAIAGALAIINNMDIPTSYAMGLAFTPIVDNLIKIFFNRISS